MNAVSFSPFNLFSCHAELSLWVSCMGVLLESWDVQRFFTLPMEISHPLPCVAHQLLPARSLLPSPASPSPSSTSLGSGQLNLATCCRCRSDASVWKCNATRLLTSSSSHPYRKRKPAAAKHKHKGDRHDSESGQYPCRSYAC